MPGVAATRTPNTGPPGDEAPQRYFAGLSRKPAPEPAAALPEPGKPIIAIVIDALRPDHLGCYGYGRPTSPALDELADEGLILTRYFANAPWTRPSTTTMLTGLIPAEHRVQCDWHRLPASVGTVAEELKKAGYTTLAVVGNGNVSSAFGLHRGFDVYEDTTANWQGLPSDREVLQLAAAVLKKHLAKTKKLYLFVFILGPHDPYRPEPPYDRLFMPDYKGKVIDRPHWEYRNDYPEPQRQKMMALYDGMIRNASDQIGRFVSELRKMGIYDEASLFITADHGESFGEHGVYLHAHHHYETHIRIPMIIKAPWLRSRGTYSSAFLQQIDLGPTLLQLAGADKPDRMPGVSMADALRDRSRLPVPRYVTSEYQCYGIRRNAIRTRRYKLVHQKPALREVFEKHVKRPELLPSVSFDADVFQLYDVLADPREQSNLWPAERERVGEKLRRLLEQSTSPDAPPRRVEQIDPELVEQLRSLGYMQ